MQEQRIQQVQRQKLRQTPRKIRGGGNTEEAEAPADDEASADEADVNEDGTVNNPEAVQVDENKLVFWSLFSGGDGGFMDEIIADYNSKGPSKEVQSIMLVWCCSSN